MPGLLRKAVNARFDDPAEPCPVSTLRTHLKQVNRSELDQVEAGILNAFFGGFMTGMKPPEEVSRLSEEYFLQTGLPGLNYGNRILRRYDGDTTLPAGRYSTICTNADGNDGGTFVREMMFYADPRIAEAHIEVYDPGVPEHSDILDQLGMNAGAGERVVIRVFPFAQDGEIPATYRLAFPISVTPVEIERVLDLRRPEAAQWLCRTISRLTYSIDGRCLRCFPKRLNLNSFPEMVYSLLDQVKGGGNFHIIVGLYLRQLGIAGLVFPSARGNATVEFAGGVTTNDRGWSFVDYRNAPPPAQAVFFELRPNWPVALTLEGGDHNKASDAAFSDEVSIVAEGYDSGQGRLVVRGLEERMRAYFLGASMDAAVRFRLRELNEGLSNSSMADPTTQPAAEQLMGLIVQLPMSQATKVAGMILASLQGSRQAQHDVRGQLLPQLRGHAVEALLIECSEPYRSPEQANVRHLQLVLSGLGSRASMHPPPEPAS